MILKKYMKPFLAMMLLNSMSYFAISCITAPPETKLKVNWVFINIPGEEEKACLPMEDVIKIKEALRRCENR